MHGPSRASSSDGSTLFPVARILPSAEKAKEKTLVKCFSVARGLSSGVSSDQLLGFARAEKPAMAQTVRKNHVGLFKANLPFDAEQQSQQPAHAGETVEPRQTVIRVAPYDKVLPRRPHRRFALRPVVLPNRFETSQIERAANSAEAVRPSVIIVAPRPL
jgi:hypothetical protein